ncbi:endospore germination permease [Paenibacillus sp. GD4]|uniref:GerAB/ArcD/ProY family transporter n=1 Tax=Paenibacillus sp. GD4 TaxID=3068890 RepID=UPI0027965E6D|nr:endospore germination permease [Paenibacillus sp. GD4]MDQ1914015.1 endospore germination permease [Paenibacillus sp. GD4]
MYNKPNHAIGILSTCSIIILAIGLMNHVMVLPPLLQVSKRDAWISVLAAILPYLAWTTILHYIIKRTDQQPILAWLKLHYGGFVAWVFRAFFLVYLFLILVMTLKDTTMWTHVSYLPKTPFWVLSTAMVLLCCFAVQSGIKTIAITSGILLPAVIIFGDFVMSANLPRKNYAMLTPMMENGWQPILSGSIFIGGGLVELALLLLIQHQIKSKVRLWPLYLLACFLILLVLGPVMGAIAEFGPFEAAELRYPAYEEWKLVSIGKYIRHVDFLSIYQWLSGASIRISFSMLLIVQLITTGQKGKHRVLIIWLLGLVAVFLAELPISDMQYVVFLRDMYLPVTLWAVSGMLLVLFLLVLISNKQRVKHDGT